MPVLPKMEVAKKINFFKNGRKTSSKTVRINRRQIRTFDALLDLLTDSLSCEKSIRDIVTPRGGTQIQRNLDALEHNGNYVCILSGRFRNVGYFDNGLGKTGGTSPRDLALVRPVAHSNLKAEARHRHLQKVTLITVYENGVGDKPNIVILSEDHKNNLEMIRDQIEKKVCRFTRLYTLPDFVEVKDAEDVEMNKEYVVTQNHRSLQRNINYGKKGGGQLNNRTQPRNTTKLTPITPLEKKNSKSTSSNGSISHTSPASISTVKSDSTTRSNRSKTRTTTKKSEKSDEESPFYPKPTKHTNSAKSTRADKNSDDKGVFKAGKDRTETKGASVIADTGDTKVELTIDQMEAEEVDEEEDVTSPKDKPVENGNISEPEPKAESPKPEVIDEPAVSPKPESPKPESPEPPTNEEQNIEAPNEAATTIQKNIRGYQDRKRVEYLKDEEKKDEDAISKVQASHQGFEARIEQNENFTDSDEKVGENENNNDELTNDNVNESTPEENEDISKNDDQPENDSNEANDTTPDDKNEEGESSKNNTENNEAS